MGIIRKITSTILCEHQGCRESITMNVDRDTPLRAEAKARGWTRMRGQYGTMEDRCPQHGVKKP